MKDVTTDREYYMAYVQVSKDEYRRLIAARERLEILKGYMKSVEFPEINAIITILGNEKGEE